MIDWKNNDGFKDLPLLPSDLKCPLLENNMGEGKPLGPLLHFTGLLPFIKKNTCNCNELLESGQELQRHHCS
jgi:hypothetical protein